MKTNSAIWNDPPVITPERKLWRAVLGQAYVDAEQPLFANGTEPFERVCARSLLRADEPLEEAILKLVCEFAAIPWDRVVLWARKRYPFVLREKLQGESLNYERDGSESAFQV